ncbi:MAG: SMP-30/gluconolactonase/LRE family protein [Paracoccaceae bacterium]
MTARCLSRGVGAIAAILVSFAAVAAEPAWKVEGLDGPESALYDSKRNVIYVSNINGQATEKNGQGYIAKLSPEGGIIEKVWLGGLDAPKGLALVGGTLYVSDIDRLVAIDVEAGTVSAIYPAAGAKFLNDTAAAPDGRVFVSDMFTDTIHVLAGNKLEIFVQDEALTAPNGLLVDGDKLVVASWGKIKQGFETETLGHLVTVDLSSRAISTLGDGTPVGNLDGIEPDGSGAYLVTDWMAGGFYRIQPSGNAKLLLDLNQGSADLGIIAENKLAIIPMMMDGHVVAYSLK